MVRKLSDKKNTFCVNGGCSAEKLLTCGVSQGSILGPLLFLLYNNDLPLATSFFTFADDTSGLIKCKKINKIRSLQNKAVRIVFNGNFRAHTDPIFSRLELLKF